MFLPSPLECYLGFWKLSVQTYGSHELRVTTISRIIFGMAEHSQPKVAILYFSSMVGQHTNTNNEKAPSAEQSTAAFVLAGWFRGSPASDSRASLIAC